MLHDGNGWAAGPDGSRLWGRLGAAGLLLLTPDGRVLMQYRAEWTSCPLTWGVPGGARDSHETAAEAALRDESVRGARERDAVAFEADDGLRRVLGEQFRRVLVDEPVAALDCVVVMPAPVVRLHVAEACGDATFGRAGVRTQRLEFRDDEDLRLDA